MFKVKILVNGKDVRHNNIGDILLKNTIDHIIKDVESKVGSVKCPEHHEFPELTVKGSGVKDLSFSVSGCCEQLMKLVDGKMRGK